MALAALAPLALSAQIGGSTDILTGTVTGSDGRPVAGATVEVLSAETQITRRQATNDEGRYTIVFPDGGGQYRLTVRFIGYAAATRNIARQAEEDHLVTNVRLSTVPTQLSEVVVRAQARPQAGERPTPGSTERVLNPDQLARLPIDAGDLNLLATLAPGVVGISATDSTAAAFSVAGQRPTANNTTLDGLSFGAGSVPQDAIRTARIITNSYDVARGQFSGGLVSTTTRSGTNVAQGAFTYSARNRALSWQPVEPTSPFGDGFTQNQLGGGMGGPLIKDRLFFFGAAQGRTRDDFFPSLAVDDPSTLRRLGVTPDSVQRFLAAAQNAGVRTGIPAVGGRRTSDNVSGIARLDYLISDEHTLTLRGDWRWARAGPTRIGPLTLPQTGGINDSWGGGVMGVLTSRVGGRYVNELRAYAATDSRRATPLTTEPAGRVVVASTFADGSQALALLGFGGNAGLPQQAETRSIEATDELSWLPGDGAHRIKLGGFLNGARSRQDMAINRYGTFSYNSIADLDGGRPASFTRTLATNEGFGTSLNAAAYVGDTWRPHSALQLTYGGRVEGSHFSGAPPYNRLVDSLFALRTDRIPSEVHVSPRAGFTFMPGGPGFGPPPLIVRGGVGEFRSPPPTSLYSAAQSATGLAASDAQVACVGPAVPTPDWAAYELDPSAVPTACAPGLLLPPRSARPSVTVFSPTFTAPRAWRGSLAVTRRFLERYAAGAEASYALGVSQYGFRDVNLDATPRFTLAEERSRPVFVPPQAIVPATGAVAFSASRLHPELGQVLETLSDLRSRTVQLTLSLNALTARGALLNLSYTLTRSRDQSSFAYGSGAYGFAAPTTAGDPNAREWATSDYERRHQMLGSITYPFAPAVELTAIGRLTSGQPYTPLVGSDLNGDGARNDRAFVFDPRSASDTAVAGAMSRLLASAPAPVRDCLGRQLAQVAARNSCTTGWLPSLDLQVNARPAGLTLDRRLTLSLLTVNLLAGIDRAVHGADHLRGWGQMPLPDQTLLYVTGFDATAQRYHYAVNGRFGSPRAAAQGLLLPFQVAFQARYAVGPDPVRDRIRATFGSPGAGATTAADSRARFERLLPNPVRDILDLRDSLRLSDAQRAVLTALSDSLTAQNSGLAEALRAQLDRVGANPDPGVLFAAVRPKLQEARSNVETALRAARAVLTPEQWAKVPDAVKTPRFRGRGPGLAGEP